MNEELASDLHACRATIQHDPRKYAKVFRILLALGYRF